MITQKDPIIIITAPTAGGKTRLIKYAVNAIQGIKKFITSTTRTLRDDERAGVDYWPYSRERFIEMKEEKAFIEDEPVFSGTMYGMEWKELERIQASEHIPIVALDVKGAQKFLTDDRFDALIIFLATPEEILWERFQASIKLGERKGDSVTPEERKARMKEEIEAREYFFFVINNIDFDTAAKELEYLVSDFLKKIKVIQVG